MTDQPEAAAAIADSRVVNTEFGPLRVDTWLLRLWATSGWPADHVLKQMVADQPCGPVAPAVPECGWRLGLCTGCPSCTAPAEEA